jgi:CheY-like chemotaxis protein
MSAQEFRILFIEDSASDRRIYRRFLEQAFAAKIHIFEAETAEAGLAACKKQCPDVIILDFKLPDLDGLQVIEELRKFCDAPVIFITGQPMPLTQTQAYHRGVVKYLSKDFISSESLQAAVAEAIKLR